MRLLDACQTFYAKLLIFEYDSKRLALVMSFNSNYVEEEDERKK